ncbi:MAG: hypothetical protein VX661_12605 [Pseudomonadota bacterium]|nr:hypothetical protein [Pseudomonadota bacterium]
MARKPKAADAAPVSAIKGFNADLTCRGFQFEVGKTYTHTGKVKACEGGFHAIIGDAHPLSVFEYYAPAGSRFCRVTLSGATDTDDNVKVAGEILKVGEEIGLRDLTLEAVKWVMDRATLEGPVATKPNGLATASGYQGAATASGDQGAATASGDQGAATASGTQGAATASGTRGAATASGTRGAATASGYQGAATASGYQGAAMAPGKDGRVMGAHGVALFAVERGDWDGRGYPALSTASGIVGQDGIKPDTWYRAEAGKLVEA